MSFKISPEKLAELVARAKAGNINKPAPQHITDKYGHEITYNEKQQEFINLAVEGNSCILIGAAGTGKTTTMKGAITALIQSGKIPVIQDGDHKFLPNSGVPGIVACSFTRRAVANLRKAMPEDMKANCITIHKLLEYQPVYYEVVDPVTQEAKNTMRFEPTRNSYHPLSTAIKVVIIDEASMVSVELFQLLVDALPHGVSFIFLGDIQQLPPVFGSAILGYKMLELPTVELTTVYRQALESPIIEYATKIKDGFTFSVPEKIVKTTSKGTITFHPWKKKLHSETGCLTFSKFITTALDAGEYDPDEDMILVPFNKAFGTDEINKRIANHIAKKEKKRVFEIQAGFNKLYFSEGDKVLYDKEDAVIVEIKKNSSYLGKATLPASVTMDYWGYDPVIHKKEDSTEDIEEMLNSLADLSGTEDKVNAASHVVIVRMADSGEEVELTSAGELNALLLSYSLTVHKSQGSEWRKVFLVLHQSHAVMLQRELLYTAITRAREELYCICEPESFVNGVKSQRIKGNTLAEKAEFFKGKQEANGGMLK